MFKGLTVAQNDVFYILDSPPNMPVTGFAGGGYKFDCPSTCAVGNYSFGYQLNNGAPLRQNFTVV